MTKISPRQGALILMAVAFVAIFVAISVSAGGNPAPASHAKGLTLDQRLFYNDITAHVAAAAWTRDASVSVGNSICSERAAGYSERHVIADQDGLAGGVLTKAERTELVVLAEADLCDKYLPPDTNLHLSS